MTENHFYEKKGPYPLNEIVKTIACSNTPDNKNNIEIYGFESLTKATIILLLKVSVFIIYSDFLLSIDQHFVLQGS